MDFKTLIHMYNYKCIKVDILFDSLVAIIKQLLFNKLIDT